MLAGALTLGSTLGNEFLPQVDDGNVSVRMLDTLDLPGARISVRPPAIRGLQFGVTGADLSVSIVGDELETMHRYAREITARLEGIPRLEGVQVGREDQTPLLRVRVDRERAADLGLLTSARRSARRSMGRGRPGS